MKKAYLLIVTLLTACHDVQQCDWHCQKAQAQMEWQKEYGPFQPNMTPEQERYAVEWIMKHYPNGIQP